VHKLGAGVDLLDCRRIESTNPTASGTGWWACCTGGFAACSAARPRGPHSCREDGESERVFLARQRDPPSRQHADRPLARRRPRSPPSGGSSVGRGRSRGALRLPERSLAQARQNAASSLPHRLWDEAGSGASRGDRPGCAHADPRRDAAIPRSLSCRHPLLGLRARTHDVGPCHPRPGLVAAYEGFARELSPEEEERYYQEMALVARIFGTPASVIPGSLDEFREYFRVELESGAICVTRPACEVASVILEAQLPGPLRLLALRTECPPRDCSRRGSAKTTGCAGPPCTSSPFR
jgi:hypothetical protein